MVQQAAWHQEIRLDQLPEEMKELCEVIGFENVRKLMEAYGGCTLYIPCRVVATVRNAFVLERYNGQNTAELARKTGLTVRQIQRLVKRRRVKIIQTSGTMR